MLHSDPFQTLQYLPEKLQDPAVFEIYPKLAGMMDFIINGALEEFEDVRFKYAGPDIVRDEVVKEIIKEFGFEYVTSVMDTISNFQFNIMLEFVSLLNLLKGSREGLQLILKLLGFDTIISEWWEQNPVAPPFTFQLIVIMNTTFVSDPAATLEKVKLFAREYVFPSLSAIDFRFSISFAQKNVNFAGLVKAHYAGAIAARI